MKIPLLIVGGGALVALLIRNGVDFSAFAVLSLFLPLIVFVGGYLTLRKGKFGNLWKYGGWGAFWGLLILIVFGYVGNYFSLLHSIILFPDFIWRIYCLFGGYCEDENWITQFLTIFISWQLLGIFIGLVVGFRKNESHQIS